MLKLLLRLLVFDAPGETEESRGSAPPSSIRISLRPISPAIRPGLKMEEAWSSSSPKVRVPRSNGTFMAPPTGEAEGGGESKEETWVWFNVGPPRVRSVVVTGSAVCCTDVSCCCCCCCC